jgi:hypothetical protein
MFGALHLYDRRIPGDALNPVLEVRYMLNVTAQLFWEIKICHICS